MDMFHRLIGSLIQSQSNLEQLSCEVSPKQQTNELLNGAMFWGRYGNLEEIIGSRELT